METELNMEVSEEDDLDVEMMEIDAPITWSETFCKVWLFFCLLFIALLCTIYYNQSNMLYVPN